MKGKENQTYSVQYCQQELLFLYPLKPLWMKVETYSIPHFLFPYYLQIWEYSTQCVLGTDIWNKFIILPGFHPCINKSMKILSEHILMRANSA